MSFLSIIVIIVHIVLAVGVIFLLYKKMRETSDRGGAFGGGSGGAVFGREKGLDKNSKIALTLGILFMFSCFLVTWIVA